MSDARYRELGREAEATGDPEAALAYRLYGIRMGFEEMPETSYQVLEFHLKSLQKKINSYAKRAKKHGTIPLALHVGEKTWIERPTPDGRTARLPIFKVTVIGDAPTTEDWKFIAALHHTPSGTVIQRAWGVNENDFAEERLVGYRDKDSACEHCSLRRKRNDTYVLENRQDGTVIQVGRTCLGAFLSTSPEAALYQFKTEKQLTDLLVKGDELDEKAKPEWGVPFLTFLTHLNAGVRRRGHYNGFLTSTAWLTGLRTGLFTENGVLTGDAEVEDYHRSRAILEDARVNLQPAQEGLSQADHNLAVIVAEDTVSDRHSRLAGTILAWARRREEAARAEEARKARERFNDPTQRAHAILSALAPHATSHLTTNNGVITLGADDLARLILANGTLDETRTKLREILGEPAAPKGNGDYLGVEGEEGTWALEVTRLRNYDDRRSGSPKTVVGLKDEEGRMAIWFAGRVEASQLRRGDRIALKATVHRCGKDRYTRKPETVLTHCEVATPASA